MAHRLAGAALLAGLLVSLGGPDVAAAIPPSLQLPALAAGELAAVEKVHGVRRGQRTRGPHCYTAWQPRAGWHRHNAWCDRNRTRDWRRRGGVGCRWSDRGFRCRF